MRNWLVGVFLFALPLAAAERDFLTAAEVEQLREQQEPNLRLALYIGFAKERVSYLQQLFAREKPGRSAVIHDVLDEYTKIVEAIDTVTDDALRRRLPVEAGLKAVVEGEKQMLASLKQFSGGQHKDLSLYRFVLEQALATTEDSIELAQEDLTSRAAAINTQDAKEKAEREAAMRPGEAEEKKAAQQKEAEQKKKVPTLRRPGEATTPAKR